MIKIEIDYEEEENNLSDYDVPDNDNDFSGTNKDDVICQDFIGSDSSIVKNKMKLVNELLLRATNECAEDEQLNHDIVDYLMDGYILN